MTMMHMMPDHNPSQHHCHVVMMMTGIMIGITIRHLHHRRDDDDKWDDDYDDA